MSHLYVPPDAPLVVKVAADAVLYSHIGGGAVGMIAGGVALLAPKGRRIHRTAGNVFFVAMLLMSGIGAVVSPMLNDRVSTMAGFLTFYMVVTGWLTVKRPPGAAARSDIALALVPLAAIVAGVTFIRMAAASPTGMVDGQPPQANYVFAIIGAFGLFGDLHLILRKGLNGAPRIARHLWRLCTALTVAAASFFLGQQQMLPKAWHGSPWLLLPVFAPLALMLFWTGHTWWTRLRRRAPSLAAA